uniref:Phage Head-Tail Attachment n=1 Tax=Candidatus Kentrum sp. LFY TaxID=2126342 RepID=A0A450W790_9GAMM|nr:MAG: Phage Head-Tail Attachment [Candidatus Kentron sp. LFY]
MPDFRAAVLKASQDAVKALGQPVTLEDGSEITGIFSNPTGLNQLSRGGGISGKTPINVPTSDPTLIILAQDAEGLTRGEGVTVNSKSSNIVEMLPDGNGKVKLILTESQPVESGDGEESDWR